MTLLVQSEWESSIFDGTWRPAEGGDAPVVEPASGAELGRLGIASASDVARSAARARDAQRAWGATNFHERAAVLRRAATLWETHSSEVANWLVREAGSTFAKARGETSRATDEANEAANLASMPLGEILPTSGSRMSFAQRIPVGVVGVIAPFNFPLVLALKVVSPALALGNAVILKPDPRTGVSGGLAIARIFEEAGLPEGVLHVLPGDGTVGEALVRDPNVQVISFTGSTAAGRRVAEAAAPLLKRVHLELGGNSALVVLDDVDVELAASAGAWGSFLHQGQTCMATSRHLVHERVAADYIDCLAAKAEKLLVGDPATSDVALGPIIDAGQRDRVHGLVESSVSHGAKLVAGGTYENLFYRPTVLSAVSQDTPAWAEEIFGPVAPVATFSTLEEVIALATDTPYGLSLGVLSRDVMKALEVAKHIPSGMVHINDQTVGAEPVAPFGGVGASGNGSRVGGARANIESFTETQWVTVQSSISTYPF